MVPYVPVHPVQIFSDSDLVTCSVMRWLAPDDAFGGFYAARDMDMKEIGFASFMGIAAFCNAPLHWIPRV